MPIFVRRREMCSTRVCVCVWLLVKRETKKTKKRDKKDTKHVSIHCFEFVKKRYGFQRRQKKNENSNINK